MKIHFGHFLMIMAICTMWYRTTSHRTNWIVSLTAVK